jgi:superfamily I DNA and/or RNA helicase
MIFLDTLENDAKDSTQNELSQELESKYNEIEANFSASILSNYIEHILKYSPNSQDILIQLNQFGIITAYRAQNQRIYECLEMKLQSNSTFQNIIHKRGFSSIDIFKSIEIDTVDRFQGQEKEIILYNFVDSNLEHEISSLHLELRRLNVAISRAKKKLIFIGHSATLCNLNSYDKEDVKVAKALHKDLIDYCKNHHSYIVLPKK